MAADDGTHKTMTSVQLDAAGDGDRLHALSLQEKFNTKLKGLGQKGINCVLKLQYCFGEQVSNK
jgi:hypothetical protein